MNFHETKLQFLHIFLALLIQYKRNIQENVRIILEKFEYETIN